MKYILSFLNKNILQNGLLSKKKNPHLSFLHLELKFWVWKLLHLTLCLANIFNYTWQIRGSQLRVKLIKRCFFIPSISWVESSVLESHLPCFYFHHWIRNKKPIRPDSLHFIFYLFIYLVMLGSNSEPYTASSLPLSYFSVLFLFIVHIYSIKVAVLIYTNERNKNLSL